MSLVQRGQVTETVSILYPTGEREYWSTDRVFVPGDVIKRNRRSWIVARIDSGSGRNSTVVVMPEFREVESP